MQITITRPDDWHLHLRDGEALAAVLPHTARQFARAIVMPNLRPPVTTVAAAGEYRARILAALPAGVAFEPLMTLYLTDNTPADEIRRAVDCDFVHAVKLYPAGATTNSDSGVTDLDHCDAALGEMAELGMPLLVHGEATDPAIDVFDREKVFIERVLQPLLARHPALKVVFEHITTSDAADFVAACGPNVAATITAHHLLYNRNAIFAGGVRRITTACRSSSASGIDWRCCARPLRAAEKFFLGTDSAPHARTAKETACGCAGCYTAHAALELYAEAFASVGALDRLEAFASFNGPDFYGLPRNPAR
jgi:dihydroorotase